MSNTLTRMAQLEARIADLERLLAEAHADGAAKQRVIADLGEELTVARMMAASVKETP